MIVWSFTALASGTWPTARRDGQALGADRRAKQGNPLARGLAGVLCEMRADLLEHIQAMGFKTRGNVDRPCFLCSAARAG
eukprot:5132052-Alexandrium_andersonii.AAC.1